MAVVPCVCLVWALLTEISLRAPEGEVYFVSHHLHSDALLRNCTYFNIIPASHMLGPFYSCWLTLLYHLHDNHLRRASAQRWTILPSWLPSSQYSSQPRSVDLQHPYLIFANVKYLNVITIQSQIFPWQASSLSALMASLQRVANKAAGTTGWKTHSLFLQCTLAPCYKLQGQRFCMKTNE